MKNFYSQIENNFHDLLKPRTFYNKPYQIEAWLDKFLITKYTIVKDEKYGYAVDVDDMVLIVCRADLKWIPVKFRKVSGSFNCYSNELTSLEFAPEECDSFNCSHNHIESLIYAPKIVHGHFNCSFNRLISLEHSPHLVEGNYDAKNNRLKTLYGAPKKIMDSFVCIDNYLSSLEHCPEEIEGGMYCDNNQLETLKFLPKYCPEFSLSKNSLLKNAQSLTSFEDVYNEHIKEICTNNKNKLYNLINEVSAIQKFNVPKNKI